MTAANRRRSGWNFDRRHRYTVSVRLVETFTVSVTAETAREAVAKVRRGEYAEAMSAGGEREWASVRAKRDD